MYGWKGRIGLVIPASNTTIEPEFNQMAPEGVSIHASRAVLKDVTSSGLTDMEEEIYKAASVIMAVGPSVIVVGCTTGSLIKGLGYDQKMIQKIKNITNVEVITTSTAVIEALRSFKIAKVAVATPYTDEVNQRVKNFIDGHGFQVIQIKCLGYHKFEKSYPLASRPVSGIGLLDPSVAYNLARDVDTNKADGIFISCTNFRTIEIIKALEDNLGKPVITSNQATMAMALGNMGIKEKVRGYGSLLDGSFF